MSQSGADAKAYILNLRSRNLYIIVFIIWGLTFFFGWSPFLFADTAPSTVWQKTWNGGFEDWGRGIAIDSACNVIITGYCTGVVTTGYDIYTIKYNTDGNSIWAKGWNGPSSLVDSGYAVGADPSGNIFVTGSSYNASNSDMVIIKYDSAGNTLWVRTWNSGDGDCAYGGRADKSGNFFPVGYYGQDIGLIKYDSSGNSVWQQVMDPATQDIGYGVAFDDTYIYLTGAVMPVTTRDIYTVKFTSAGNTVWIKQYNGGSDEWGMDVVPDNAGNIYVTGYTTGTYSATKDVLTIKYDSNGNTIWQRVYNYGWDDISQRLAIDKIGNIYIIGDSGNGSNRDIFIIKYTPEGDTVWVKRYDSGLGDDFGKDIVLDDTGNIYVAGWRYNGANNDYIVIKYRQAEAKKLRITSQPLSITRDYPSPKIYVEAWDDSGYQVTSFNETIALFTDSSGGKFSVSSTTWYDTSEIRMKSGSAVFYYKDSNAGTVTITVARQGMVPDSQLETVTFPTGTTNEYMSFIRIPQYTQKAMVANTTPYPVMIMDQEGTPQSGRQVYLYAARGNSTTVNYNPMTTDLTGQCTFSVNSLYAGQETFTAQTEGRIIFKNIYSDAAVALPFEDAITGVSTLHDVSGRGHHIAKTGTYEITGMSLGGALKLAGAESTTIVNTGIDQLLNTPSFSVMMWIKPGQLRIQGLIDKTINAWRLYMSDVSGHIKFDAILGNYGITSTSSAQAGVWTHIAAVFDSAAYEMRLYINGVCETVATGVSSAGNTLVNDINISPAMTNRYDGCMDELRIYGRALSDREIWFEYALTAGVFFTANTIKVTTAPQVLNVNAASETITVQAQGALGGRDILQGNTITLSTTSTGGRFSLDRAAWSDTTMFYFISGERSFFYRDSGAGTATITAFSPTMGNATQVETINALVVSNTRSYLILNPPFVDYNGISECTASIFIKDAPGTAIQGRQVTLYSSRGVFDTITQPASLTDTSGVTAGWIRSSTPGTSTITALCDGKTVSCSPAGTVLTFGRPIMAVSKILKNVRTNETGTSVPVNVGDTIEYYLTAQNAGNETATEAVIVDTKAFDTFTNDPVIFIGMDTFPADTWAYTLVLSPSDTEWIAGVPASGSTSLKGLKWKFYFHGPGKMNQVKFRVRIK